MAELGLGPTTIQPQHLNSQSLCQINLTGGSHSSPNLQIVIALNSMKLVLRVEKRPHVSTPRLYISRTRTSNIIALPNPWLQKDLFINRHMVFIESDSTVPIKNFSSIIHSRRFIMSGPHHHLLWNFPFWKLPLSGLPASYYSSPFCSAHGWTHEWVGTH